MEEIKEKRDEYVDVLKGIGIVSVVIGHASWNITLLGKTIPVGPFVYLYHLAIFFFCSGYLFKDNISEYWSFVGKKLRGFYKPFIIYSVLYLMFRNIFIGMGILEGEKYSLGQLSITFTNMITFNSVGELLGAFWFLPVLFFSVCFYAAVQVMTKVIKNTTLREAIRLVAFFAFGILGLYATENKYGLLCNMQIAYLMVPIVALGHYVSVWKNKIDRYVNIVGLVISFGIMILVLSKNIGIIELSNFQIINHYAFFPVTICGIYFCLGLAKILCKSTVIRKMSAYIGRISFDIMAFHFMAFKLLDFVVCHIINREDIMNIFPHSFTNLWPAYYIVGIIVPIFVVRLRQYLKVKFRCFKMRFQ